MPAPLLLIDGYNLMHAAGMAPRGEERDGLRRGRERLLGFLGERLTVHERSRAVVVFDARDPPAGRPTQLVMCGVRALFALPEGDADLVLDRLLAEQRSKNVTVVSSDKWVQSAARGRRARFVGSTEFLAKLTGRTPRTGVAGDLKDRSLSPADVNEWLAVFGGIDPVAMALEDSLPIAPAGPAEAVASAGERTSESPQRRRSSRRIEKSPVEKSPVDELQYWLSVFGHLDRANLEDL